MAGHVADFSKTPGADHGDGRLHAPAAERNFAPICEVLAKHLTTGNVLEIGSGTGEHITGFAERFTDITWWPSDPLAGHLSSIAAWIRYRGPHNVRAPVALDATDDWKLGQAEHPPDTLDAIIASNVIHIAPWAVAEGIVEGAGRHLAPGGHLILYGPYTRQGRHTSESNAKFDQGLRADNPGWGVRDVADVEALANFHGLDLTEIAEMPANNLTLVFTQPR